MWIKVRIVDNVVCGNFTSDQITGEEMIQQAGRELMDLVEAAAESRKLLLSFAGVQFMSSAMIGKLVLLNKLAKARGVQVKFCDLNPNVLEVFNITRLDKVFRILRREDDDDPNHDDPNGDGPDDDGPGNAGVFAKLPKHPGSGGTHAKPPPEDP